MKCLEFLYFYLLDETTDSALLQRKHKRSGSTSTNMTAASLLYSPAPSTAAPSPRTPHHPHPSTPFPRKPPRLFTPTTPRGDKLLDPETPSTKHRKTPAHLLILNRPVDFVPLSPKKRAHEQDDTLINEVETEFFVEVDDDTYDTGVISPTRRTTEEKKELLGCLLGNVDALVEGVRKAGVWGLG